MVDGVVEVDAETGAAEAEDAGLIGAADGHRVDERRDGEAPEAAGFGDVFVAGQGVDHERVFEFGIVLEVAIPGRLEAHGVGKRSAGIQSRTKESKAEIEAVSTLEAVADEAVRGVFGKHPQKSDGRSDDEIDPAGVIGGVHGAGIPLRTTYSSAVDRVHKAAFVAKAGLAEEADLGVGAVDNRPQEGVEPTLPVCGIGANLKLTARRVVLYLNEV